MSSLTPEQIAELLKEEAQQAATRRTRGPKVDPTTDRTVVGWNRLFHHICTRDCPHRAEDSANPTEYIFVEHYGMSVKAACWNVDCLDTVRDKVTDRGAQIVCEVKGQFMCRYCYIAGWLSG